VSQQARIHLKRGRHDFLFYHLKASGDGRFTVAWQRPDSKVFEVIPRVSFAIFARGNPGPLEELHKTIVADFSYQYAGDSYYADQYSHHYVFSAQEPKAVTRANYEWDFGDGQTASGPLVEHVYLTDGEYPIKLSVRLGEISDSQTNKLAVSRDWPHIDNPALDKLSIQSRIVSSYNVERMPEEWLPRATWLHERAGNIDAMLQVATRLAALTRHPIPDQAFAALQGASKAAAAKGQSAGAVKMWDEVPATSDLQPRAAGAFARLLLWQTGDIPKAAAVLGPWSGGKNQELGRLYGQALVLNNKAADGRALLQSFQINEEANKRAAKSGALARTIEYYIQTKEWEIGEEQWENWQQQYPADFMEGYSIVLKMKLMELKGAPQAAAAVAEAFAKSVPGSSYAPQLLSGAGKLLEKTDPPRSQGLIKLLKERYPEDPLAQ
jgi:PKD repeat protein